MRGVELADGILRVKPLTPINLVTGLAFLPEHVQTSADLVLKKPLLRGELRSTLRELCGRSDTLSIPV